MSKSSENKSLSIDVNITETDLFQDIIQVIKEVLNDEDISKEVKEKYSDKMDKVIKKHSIAE